MSELNDKHNLYKMIAIQRAKGGFDDRWVDYCKTYNINYKIVDCYKNNIINQMKDCNALMWQFYQGNPKDILMAKCLMFSLEHTGVHVFPDFRSAWHFDDKVGQKYLLEGVGAPFVPAWVFYDKAEALQWADKCEFPKVFKLRGGAGSQNVRLVRTKRQAFRLIHQAFGRGFPSYDPIGNLKERLRLLRLGKTTVRDVLEGLARFVIPPPYAILKGRDKGYIYFQDYIPDNDHDIRVIVIGDKALAIKRMVRDNDFRASGSGNIKYDKDLFDVNTIKLSFELAEKLQTQCVACDFVHDHGKPLIVEISFGFTPAGYIPCPGYWDKDLTWHDGKFNPYGWMVEDLLKSVRDQK